MTFVKCSDQMGVEITLPKLPQKIISLVPSQTELLATLGLDKEVVGITKFCIHPPSWRTTKTIVGGTKNFDFEAIDRLNPDVIIGNKEENYQEGIDKLREKYPVWMSDITNLIEALTMIQSVGLLTGRADAARAITSRIDEQFQTFHPLVSASALYLIWQKPWMAAGKNTFVDDMMRRIGFRNVVQRPRYPRLEDEEIQSLSPEFILLSSEPFPFSEKHRREMQNRFIKSKILLVDGEMFSWYGSRLQFSCDYFRSLSI